MVRANSWGQFSIPQRDGIRTVVLRCEGATPIVTSGGTPRTGPDNSLSFDLGLKRFAGVRPPVVVNIVLLSILPAPQGITSKFDKESPPTGLPSDVVPLRPAKFLAMKGLDTRQSACEYYRAIGAVRRCDAQGNIVKNANGEALAVSFDDWKRTIKIDNHKDSSAQQLSARFVNVNDLNLTRRHEMISYGQNQTAAYVCNYPPPDALNPDKDKAIDRAIENADADENRVACVAMDYSISPNINGGRPFMRFLIFGPSGELLPSVNLDGLGEKFVPGTCLVCHGGNRYAGMFPTDGTGRANVDGHFLPFDIGPCDIDSCAAGKDDHDHHNLKFHGSPFTSLVNGADLTLKGQQSVIHQMNSIVRSNTNATSAERELIDGWYNKDPLTQDTDFSPPGTDKDYYLGVIAKSCRSCHIVLRDENSIKNLNFFEHAGNIDKTRRPTPNDLAEVVCGASDPLGGDLLRAYSMPNSLVTFNQFWQSNQPGILATMIGPRVTTPITLPTPFDCRNPNAP